MTLYEDMLKNIKDIYEHVGCDFPAGALLGNLEMNWILTSGDTLYYGEEKDQLEEYSLEITTSRTYPKRVFRGEYYTLVIGGDGCGNTDSYLFLTSKEVPYV